ncbi:MAG: HlyD family secretion protein [Bacteroidales bacterium]
MKQLKLHLFIVPTMLFLMFSCNNEDKNRKDNNTMDPDSVKVISGYGRVGAYNEITGITSEVNGLVKEIYHEEGDTVREGDAIFSLRHQDAQTMLSRLSAEISSAELAIDITKQTLETAKKTAENKETHFQRVKKAFEDGTQSRQGVDNARLQMEQAQGRTDELQLQIRQQRHDLQSLRQQYRQRELDLEKHFIKAPGDGIILDLDIDRNDAVKALQPVGEFRYAGPAAIEAEIDELYAARIDSGQQAYAIPYGRSDTVAWGTLTQTSPQLSQKSMFSDESTGFLDRRVRTVEIRIDSTAGEILIGQRVNVFIKTR